MEVNPGESQQRDKGHLHLNRLPVLASQSSTEKMNIYMGCQPSVR